MKEEDSKSWILVECIGKPQFNKKNAADSAAEGVLWYLVHLGYPKKAWFAQEIKVISSLG